MSCRILVNSSDSFSDCQQEESAGAKRKYYLGQGRSNFLSNLSRTILFRRPRLLKIYMAAAATILILFFLLKPRHIESDHLTENKHPLEPVTDGSTKNFVPRSDHQQSSIGLASGSMNSHQIGQPTPPNIGNDLTTRSGHQYSYPSNFTYTLSAQDFAQMKNINLMQVRIREAAKHSWDNYRRYAWGHDMLKPRAKEPDQWFDLGLTIVDGVDTLIMMGLLHETNLALDWIENDLNLNSKNENSNCFELTIRILAGLLSAYHLTGREKLKQQAIEFGDILLHCYDTESQVIPFSDIDLSTQRAHPPQWNPHSSLSEVTSLQLEFRFLSQISGNPKYEATTFRTSVHVHQQALSREHKLLPMYINPNNGQFEESVITLGARSDSYYEYLLKQYLQTGIKWLEDDYLECVDEIQRNLLRHTNGLDNYTYVAEMQVIRTFNDTEDVKYYNKMDHLVCFLPGTLVLGYYHFSPQASEYRLKYNLETPTDRLNSRYDNHLEMAKALARTCYHMYSNMGTGLSPEIATFVHSQTNNMPAQSNQPELQVQSTAAHNILRPEYVESLFYLYHITGLPMYRKEAEEIFEAFQKYSRIPTGYSAISDVRTKPSSNEDLDEALHQHAPDRMESFWLSETLKYFYLTFCDDKHIVGTILNNYVFNTEAHLIPITMNQFK